MNEDISSIILIVGVVGVVIYLIHAQQENQPAAKPSLQQTIDDALSGIGNFFNQYEFNSDDDSGDDAFIPTM